MDFGRNIHQHHAPAEGLEHDSPEQNLADCKAPDGNNSLICLVGTLNFKLHWAFRLDSAIRPRSCKITAIPLNKLLGMTGLK